MPWNDFKNEDAEAILAKIEEVRNIVMLAHLGSPSPSPSASPSEG